MTAPYIADSLWKLLPMSSTKLERDTLRAVRFDSELDPAVPLIASPKRGEGILEQWLPWLVVEYGLAELQEFIPDMRELIDQGLAFGEVRGTPAGIELAAEFAGFSGAEFYHQRREGIHFPEFELILQEVPDDPRTLCRLVKAVRLAKPLRSRFRRVVSGWDRRPLVLDKGRMDGSVLLDNFSGVLSGKLGLCPLEPRLWVSFGRRYDLSGDGADDVSAECGYVRDNFYSAKTVPLPWPVLDRDFSGKFHPTIAKASSASYSFSCGGVANADSLSWHEFSWSMGSWVDSPQQTHCTYTREQL